MGTRNGDGGGARYQWPWGRLAAAAPSARCREALAAPPRSLGGAAPLAPAPCAPEVCRGGVRA